MGETTVNDELLNRLIATGAASGGSELANYQLFVIGLCEALGLDRPNMASEQNHLNDYVFERRVDFKHADGTRTAGRIDCYRRGSFILEAKQSGKRVAAKYDESQVSLLPEDAFQRKPGQAKRGTRGWDQVLLAARRQAEDYARALPVEHGYPPFLLVVDVGNVIEVYADFSGQGKNYAHFPDRQTYRIGMEDLRDAKVQTRLRTIWTDPQSLDPTKISAEVTRDIAERLAKIAKRLEGKHDAKDVAEFLMRCLFTMFAEDVKLLPEKGFHTLLGQMRDTPQHFVAALEGLWSVMDSGGYAPHLNATLKKFNGSLFKKRIALPLDKDDITELWIAAGKDWSDVEPAIFGTLLERALNPRERSKLGAHYTPRAYVERLVIPTIIEPLRADWEAVQGQVKELRDAGNHPAALAAVKTYHHMLCTTRVLDPACGTGNFLYVSLELMKRLEGEVLEALDDLGQDQARFTMEGETVNPRQFYGLELNPRAVPIADLVLWIGYLKWQLKTAGVAWITEPILHAYGTIKQQDAIITYDRQELLRDARGLPLSRWDGVTKKLHPITGEEIPDPDAQVPLYTYVNPKRSAWPEVDFIVGNPPFIGGKDMRAELGDGYAEACWAARPYMPGGADFVMHFWDEAATRLLRRPTKGQANPLRRFGFITTNSITQTFSRRVIERYTAAKAPLSLVYAIPNHPWMKASDKAAVRIAMTVAETGEKEGLLGTVVSEAGLNTDTPQVVIEGRAGKILPSLTVGANLDATTPLLANDGVAIKGFELGTQALLLENNVAAQLVRAEPAADRFLFSYMNGNDFKNGRAWRRVIDTYPASWGDLQDLPMLQNYLLENVKSSRSPASDTYVLDKWWQFRRTGEAIRVATSNLSRFIATTRTSKHRFFGFLPADCRAESKTVIVAMEHGEALAILSSRVHVEFSIRRGGRQGVGDDPVYQHTDTFNPFPFPFGFDTNVTTNDRPFARRERLRGLGERLDGFRKERLAKHSLLTMTSLYNALERLRELENGCPVAPLTEAERDVHDAGLISGLKDIHDEIDRTVLAAYGWEDLTPSLLGRPGATVPSVHKSEETATDGRGNVVSPRRPEFKAGRGREARHRPVAEARLPNPKARRQGSPATGRTCWDTRRGSSGHHRAATLARRWAGTNQGSERHSRQGSYACAA
ncbi:DNA methyltransferase [Mesorhizobium sp. INR15]|uniref:class I SAM-dependent DNA methyltransferase n=1 Tax=Mesorhizobium sp. INR15 TaxID=2654248 RepID=UPI0021560CE8|nr:DNA methyltransferase [Mesorhizobium sp. INR15]